MMGAILIIATVVYVIGILVMTDIWSTWLPLKHQDFMTRAHSVAWRLIIWPFYVPFLLAWIIRKNLIVIVCLLCGLAASQAAACQKCGLFGNRCAFKQVQAAHVQQLVAAPIVYPQVNYFVGAPIRVEAIVQRSLQENPEYAEFQRFRAWKQELERKPTVGEPLNKPIETIPQTIPTSLLVARCSQCHSGDNPKGGLLLDGTAELTCDQALRAMKMVQAGKMPPKNKLTPEDAGGVFQDLLDLVKTK